MFFAFFFSQTLPFSFGEIGAEVLTPLAQNIRLTDEERQDLSGVYKDTWNYLATFADPETGIPYDSEMRGFKDLTRGHKQKKV